MKNNAVIAGAGKIGRGYIAEMLKNGGFHIVFLVHSEDQTRLMKERGSYIIFRADENDQDLEEVVIDDYDAYCTVTEEDRCVEAIVDSDVIFLPVYPKACPDFGRMIAKAINIKADKDDDPFDVIMSVNFLQATKTIRDAILPHLTEKGMEFFNEKVGISETLVNRMVVDPTEEMAKRDPLSIVGGHSAVLKVDKDTLKNTFPEGMEVDLLDKLPARFTYKIWVVNMMHFAVSIYGAYLGYRYVREACGDPYVAKSVHEMARKEGVIGVANEFGLAVEDIEFGFYNDPWSMWENPESNDPFARVVMDMRRKLSKTDRVIGPALSCMKAGKIPFFLAKIAALALKYENQGDPTSVELHRIMDEKGIRAALHEFSELSEDVKEEKMLMDLIEDHYVNL
ncbi:MAG: NAD-binding protein [Clostridia bacterium]|nr:NAD-binding protein [Clostridia bacterium]